MSLLVKIGADLSSFEKQMKKATRDTEAIAKKLSDIGTTLSTNVTLPIMGLGAAALKVGVDFEKSMSKVAAISGATGDEFEALEEKAKEMGATTQFSASQSAEAFSYMAMAGWKTEDMLSGIEGVMSLAAASGEDLAMVSDIVTDSLTAFGLSADDSARFADVLASASSNANTNVAMLGESFKYVAPVAGALGFSIEDTTKALSLMANAGIKGSESGTALRTMMTNLAKPTSAMEDAMEELGISLTNTDGTMKTLDEVVLNLRDSFDGLSEAQQASYAATIFGKEAMSGALAVINATEDDYNKLSVAIDGSEGSSKKMADTMQNNLQGRLTKLKSALEGIGIQLSETLIPIIEKVVSKIQIWVDWFAGLDESTQKLIVTVSLIVAAIGPLVLIVGKTIALYGQLKAAALILGPAIGAISWPVVAITVGIAALVAGGIALYKNWDTVKAKASSVWNGIKEAVRGPANSIIGFANGVISAYERMINGMASAVNRIPSFSIPDWVPLVGGKTFSIPHISGVSLPRVPALATGTNYVPQDMLAFIHKGEAVVPKQYNPALGNHNKSSMIIIELDGRQIAKGTLPHISDQIRMKTGLVI